jgi:hypothetical protein
MWIEVALVLVFSLFLLGLATWLAGQSLSSLTSPSNGVFLAVDPNLITRANDLTASKLLLIDWSCLIASCSLWFCAM